MRRRVLLGLILSVALGAQRVEAQASMVPEWFGRDGAVLGGTREGTVADVRALYEAAAPAQLEAVSHALLLCHVVAAQEGRRGRWDTFADPDLRVSFTAGSFRSSAWGTENATEAWVSFADVSFGRRARLGARVFDRDVTGDETIGALSATYDGTLPFTMRATYASMECRLGDAALAAREATAWLARAEQPIALAETARPDLSAADLGRPDAANGTTSGAIAMAMAYGGLREPRARALGVRLRAATAAFDRLLVAEIGRALAAPREETVLVAGTTTTLRVEPVICGTRRVAAAFVEPDTFVRCVVPVVLDPPSSTPETVLGMPELLDRRGSPNVGSALLRSASDPARVGIAFTVPVRARGTLLRVGTGARTTVVLR